MKSKLLIAAATCVAVSIQTSFADTGPDALLSEMRSLRQSVAELQKLVREQQKKLSALEEKQVTAAAVPIAVPIPPKSGGTYVPDIGVVADIVGMSSQSKEDEDGNDRLSVREVELVFGHDIDPYSRMDVIATFSDQEDPEIEEANVTYWGLPWGIKGRVGRMRQRIGKASATHRDVLDTVDEPLVIDRYFGHEGLFRTGLELSAFTPLSLDEYTQELVLGIMEGGGGEGGTLFGETRRAPSFYGHLANFVSLSDDSSFELGGTYLAGSQDEDSAPEVSAFGIDATLSTFITPRNKFKLQSEMYLQRSRGDSRLAVDGRTYDRNPYGFYSLADYRFAERWGAGFRYDYVQPTLLSEGEKSSERGYSAYLTFFQSEFARWRLQYQRMNLLDGSDDNRFFLQGTFAIGAHKHQLN